MVATDLCQNECNIIPNPNDKKGIIKNCLMSDHFENEPLRKQTLHQMREWVENHSNIRNCRTDSSFLLRFLRIKKYCLEDAKALLEKYLRMRQENPKWFRSLDIKENRMESLIDRGYFFALKEKDDYGRRVFFSMPGCLSTSTDTAADMMRGVQIGLESLINDEENQIRGFSYIFEEKDVGLSIVTLWNYHDVSKAFSCSEKTIPMRHKEIHFVHLPLTLYAVFEVAKAMLSDKIKRRFQVHNDLESLCKSVPKRILPKEYGGSIPMNKMIELYKEELNTNRSKVLQLDDIVIEKSCKQHRKIEKAVSSLQRTFRRMEID